MKRLKKAGVETELREDFSDDGGDQYQHLALSSSLCFPVFIFLFKCPIIALMLDQRNLIIIWLFATMLPDPC